MYAWEKFYFSVNCDKAEGYALLSVSSHNWNNPSKII